MMSFSKVLVLVLGLPLLVAACGEDENKAGGGGAGDVTAKCTENMKAMTASNAQMKPLVGKEAQVCGCLVSKVKDDKSLKDADRTAIYAGLSTKPGTDAAKAAQAKMTDASNKAVMTAMAACSQEFMKK